MTVRPRARWGDRLRNLPTDRKALVFVLLFFVVLISFRTYHFSVTGYLLPDEHGYIFYAMPNPTSGIPNSIFTYPYSTRDFLGFVNRALFGVLSINDIDSFSYFMPLYLVSWASATLVLYYLILQSLQFDRQTAALSLLSSMFLVSFVLFSLGFLSEPMGLTLAMLGIYFMLRFWRYKGHGPPYFIYPFLSALSFAAAKHTREPYVAFLYVGAIPVALIALANRSNVLTYGRVKGSLAIVSAILLFAIPSRTFILYPIYTSPAPSALLTILTAPAPAPILVNTLAIFVAGLVLGWGPILLAVGFAGGLVVLKELKGRDVKFHVVFWLTGFALGSFLLVAYLYSGEPGYLSVQHISTIIRFSDTSLPAYFLLAPFALSRLGRRRLKYYIGFSLVLFALLATPTYFTVVPSNLGVASSPFSLSYRTSGAQIRDYFQNLGVNSQIPVIGLNKSDLNWDSWWWTPGDRGLGNIQAFPYIPETVFVGYRWTTFYIFGDNVHGSSVQNINEQQPYLGMFLLAHGAAAGNGAPYSVISTKTVVNGSVFLVHVSLSWSNSSQT